MLTELRIRNFAIIEDVALELADGLTVLTGETGAGKSILVDAVDLLVGGRAALDLIRTGAEEAEISGVFALEESGPVGALLREHDLLEAGQSELIIRRLLSRTGRHRLHVNGRPAPLAVLQALRGLLVDIHGQHDQQSLFRPSVQLDLLDEYGSLADARRSYRTAYDVWQARDADLRERQRTGADRQARLDLWRYQAQEIAGAQLRPGEDRDLERERLLLSQGRRLAELGQAIYGPLYEEESSLLDGLRRLVPPLKELSAIDTDLVGERERFDEAVAQLADLAHRLREYRDRLEYDPQRLEQIEERLDLIRKMVKKYGGSIEEAIKQGDEAARALRELDTLESDLAALATQVAGARAQAATLAESLSRKRRKAAGELEQRLEKELTALQMPRARVQILVGQPAEPSLTATGMDRIEFLFSANPGEPLQPLARVASGGELSRVMLAFKTVLAGADRVPVMIFDEVDAGIGGAAAEVVGKRLRHLARHGHQVFCITHLAPIAAHAQHHFAVSKGLKNGRTVTQVQSLDAAGRVEEVARMLGGATITAKVRATAAEMLQRHG